MTAQVNLYQAQFRKKHVNLSASRILALNSLMVIAMVILLGIDGWKISTLTQQQGQLRQTLAQINLQWTDIQTKLVKLKANDELELQAKKLETILAMHEPLLDLSRTDSFANTQGYSEYLIALARQHKPGMWLTNINISQAGRDLNLQGMASQAVLVPQYIQRLAQEDIISGIPVHRFSMNRKTDDYKYISFVIASQTDDES